MKKTISHISFILLASGMVLAGCSPTDNPQLSICQDITSHLLPGQQLSWGKHTETEAETGLQIDLAFSAGGGSMQSSCYFAPDDANDEDTLGDVSYDSAPTSVVLNGRRVDERSLTQATMRATNQAVTETAEHTAKESRKNLETATVKVKEMAMDGSGKARVLEERARQATLKAADRVQRALEK